MYVVLDSNIWLSELGLNSSMGAATRFFLKQRRAKLALPEVIRTEVETNLKRILSGLASDIEKNHRKLLAVFGTLKEVVLPTEDQIRDRAAQIFEGVKIDIIEVPFTLESARASLQKIFAKAPPNGINNQQFKDGVVWADCMNLLAEDSVSFVTEDTDFYLDRKFEKGLATNLKEEVATRPHTFNIYHSLKELIDELRTNVEVDGSELARLFRAEFDDSIASILERNGFAIDGAPCVQVSPFVTEDPDRLYIDFEITTACRDTTPEGRSDAELKLKGDAFYCVTEKQFSEMRNRGEELAFIDGSGERKHVNVVVGTANIMLGHRTVAHSVRHELR